MKPYISHQRSKIMNRIVYFYEGWILPPHNESLLSAKKRELKEKTKYLDPKVLYTLNEEEKKGI